MKLNSNVKTAVKTRSGFDLSFDGVLSQSWGDIVPIVCKEMVPGDSFTCDASAFVRLAPLAVPTYGRIHGYINYFFVPNRILLDGTLWEDFIRGGVTGSQTFTLPYTTANSLHHLSQPNFNGSINVLGVNGIRQYRKLCTYLGLPDPNTMADGDSFRLSLLPFAAYNRIYGDYFYPWGISPNDDATAERFYFKKLVSGWHNLNPDVIGDSFGSDYFQTKRACFKKDYLTTAQIHPQRGTVQYAPLVSNTRISDFNGSIADPDNDEHVSGNPSGISAVAMRFATSFQQFLERNNIAGARYFEQILSRFGVNIPAERLDRSEYLGGKDFWINISDVTSTSSTDSASLGDMAGKGIGLGQSGVSYNSNDYGFFIATLHLMPESGVVQGINRMFTRADRFDYFTPEMEDTGLQPIYNCEVWGDLYTGISNNFVTPSDTGVFGYVPRYAEYKYSAPVLAGDFRLKEDGTESLVSFSDMDSMHLYRIFNTQNGEDIPVLTPAFLRLNEGTEAAFNRIFQDTNSDFDHFWTNIQVSLGAERPMVGYVEGSTSFLNDSESGGNVTISPFGVRL